jgi:hypothetical protein
MKMHNTDIVTNQHGYIVFARGEHRRNQPAMGCETCKHISVSYWDEPCISCSQVRMVPNLEDKWEPKGPPITRECAEAQILAHLKAVRDIAQEYAGKQFMTASFLSDGAVHIYNAAGYNDSGLPVIDAVLKGEE